MRIINFHAGVSDSKGFNYAVMSASLEGGVITLIDQHDNRTYTIGLDIIDKLTKVDEDHIVKVDKEYLKNLEEIKDAYLALIKEVY